MRRKSFSLLFPMLAVLAGIVGNLVICWNSWHFYIAITALPPDAKVWLGGRAVESLFVSGVTFIVAMPLAIAGIIFSVTQRRIGVGLASAFAVALALTPFPLGLVAGWENYR